MKITNYKKLFLFILAIDVLVFGSIGAFIIANLRTDPAAPGALVVAVATLLISFGLPFLIFRPLIRQQSIAEKGQTAAATLLEYWDTGTTINDDPQVGMLLEVHPLEGSPYQAKLKTIISRLSVNMLKPGTQVLVSYIPDRPQDLAFISFDMPLEEPGEDEQPGMVTLWNETRKARLAELEELYARHMIGDSDYRRRREELLAENGIA